MSDQAASGTGVEWGDFKQKTEQRLEVFYDELKDKRVELDSDPVAGGLTGLNVKIAEARQKANRVCGILCELIRLKARYVERQKGAKASAELAYRGKRIEQSGGDSASRDAQAKAAVANHYLVAERWEDVVSSVESCRAVAQYRYENLNNTLRDLSAQQNTVRMQISIGELVNPPGKASIPNHQEMEGTQVSVEL